MRRGLIAWSKAELPESVFPARLRRLRAAMEKEGLDALVAYTNNTRPAAVSWLTAFVPYWAEGLLAVPLSGDPLLTMAFSNRIVGWGKAVSCVARFQGTPRVGLATGKYLAELGAKRVGVVELDDLRNAVAADLAEAAPQAALSDASPLFERVRTRPDPAEIALVAKAGSIAQRALAAIRGDEARIGDALETVEGAARRAGAEEVYLAAALDLARDQRFRRVDEGSAKPGESFAVRATLAYKGSWVRMTRSVFRNGLAPLGERAAEIFSAAAAGLPSTEGFARFRSWTIEGCRTAQPLDLLRGSSLETQRPLAPDSIVAVQAVIDVDGHAVALAAPVLIGAAGFPSGALVPPGFERA
ncbi:MAG: aminopeptidase P family N-terminal domain-containing protein [Stellaceae bacterium]